MMTEDRLRKVVLRDLDRAGRLVRKIHPDPIDPQFRIATPDGDWWLAVTLPPEPQARAAHLAMVSDFMAWRMAAAFTLASELVEPDAVYCAGVSHRGFIAAAALITRKPLSIAKPRWLTPDELGQEVRALLPRGQRTMTQAKLKELETWFGLNGRFPAILLETDGAIPV
jgi:hypothetical protein